jgi:DMSO/TMAO reductase YedYZ molybdopterin-dependent catalytic subunit
MGDREPGTPVGRGPGTPVGRRVILSMLGLGAVGIALGSGIETAVSSAITGGDGFQFYTITGGFPEVPNSDYRLKVTGMVDKQLNLTIADLKGMPSTRLVHTFQCVTGWKVPDVHWTGVQLSAVLDAAGVNEKASALRFFSYDGAYTESLTLSQARLPDVLVAYEMLGGPITSDHGGPVRMYVAPMYGYKSTKWLSGIEVTNEVVPGFWEDNGYPVDAWIGGVAQ